MRSIGQFIVFLTVALSIVSGWQFYIWARLVRDPGMPEPYAQLATIALICLTIAPPLVIFAARFLSRRTLAVVSATLYTWFGIAFLLGLAFFAADLARWIGRAVAAIG